MTQTQLHDLLPFLTKTYKKGFVLVTFFIALHFFYSAGL